MSLWRTVSLSIAILSIVAASSLAQLSRDEATPSTADVVDILNAIHRCEIDVGHLASHRAYSSKVRAHASHMMDEHQLTMKNLDEVERELGLGLQQPVLDRINIEKAHHDVMEQLRESTEKEFDQLYLEYHIGLHKQVAILVDNASKILDDPQFLRFLGKFRPAEDKHLAVAQWLQREVNEMVL